MTLLDTTGGEGGNELVAETLQEADSMPTVTVWLIGAGLS